MIAYLKIKDVANGGQGVRRIILFSLLISLLASAPPSHTAAASSSLYNDLHGQWSFILPDSYKRTLEQYDVPTKEHVGFSGTTGFNSPRSQAVAVYYRECCAPDSATLAQFAQMTFDSEQQAYANARLVYIRQP